MGNALKGCGLALTGLVGIGLLAGTAMADHHGSKKKSEKKTVVAIAAGNDNFDTLEVALTKAELIDTLSGEGPFTVFAPTDAAFDKLNSRSLAATLEPRNRDRLTSILTYHVVPGRLTLSDLAERQFLTTVDGERLKVDFSNGLKINGSGIISPNIEGSNGIIHAIDAVLIPEKASIEKVADKAGFKTLLAAARAANLTGALNGNDDLTVFAPTDEAFAKLGEEKIAELLKPENRETLATILKYHVVAGRAYASDVIGGAQPETLAGETATISSSAKGLRINGVNIVKTDVNAANGVIHVIDEVLIPPSITKAANAKQASSETTRREVQSAAEIIELAIERGAPLFNDGQQAACAAIYEVAATALQSRKDIPGDAKNALRAALKDASRSHSPREQAWILRRGLDTAYAEIQRRNQQASRRHH